MVIGGVLSDPEKMLDIIDEIGFGGVDVSVGKIPNVVD